jgi:uncharacterized membrane protein
MPGALLIEQTKTNFIQTSTYFYARDYSKAHAQTVVMQVSTFFMLLFFGWWLSKQLSSFRSAGIRLTLVILFLAAFIEHYSPVDLPKSLQYLLATPVVVFIAVLITISFYRRAYETFHRMTSLERMHFEQSRLAVTSAVEAPKQVDKSWGGMVKDLLLLGAVAVLVYG